MLSPQVSRVRVRERTEERKRIVWAEHPRAFCFYGVLKPSGSLRHIILKDGASGTILGHALDVEGVWRAAAMKLEADAESRAS